MPAPRSWLRGDADDLDRLIGEIDTLATAERVGALEINDAQARRLLIASAQLAGAVANRLSD